MCVSRSLIEGADPDASQPVEREWNDRWKDGGSATIEKLFEISYSPVIAAEKESYASVRI